MNPATANATSPSAASQRCPPAVFDGVDYVALGHLHGSQTVTERVRYSGSPLAYSFSEHVHRKSMWLVDLGPGGELGAERIDCPVPRPLARLRGRLDSLLEDPALERHRESWVEATLTDPARPDEPMARLAGRFPHTLSLVFEPERPPRTPSRRTPSGSGGATTSRSRRTSWPMYAAEAAPAHRSGPCCATPSTT